MSRNIKLSFYSIVAFLITIFCANAVEVNENELKSAAGENDIVFENYAGPHTVINTAAEIRGIGTSLGEKTAKEPNSSSSSGNSAKYSIIHAVDPSQKDKLDADILIIGKDATVDHIDNVRRIIAAYLSKAYGYSQADANTVATFVTVYNAVYRGKMDTWNSKYKDIVTKNLTAEKSGIALSYREWPGNTQLVIPLSDVQGGLSAVDTSIISDKQVVKSMQGEKDKGVDSRKQMVDIKEREADNASAKAQESQKKATTESNKLKEEQKKNTVAKEEAKTAQKEAEQAQKTAAEKPNDKEAQKEAAEKQQVAKEKKTAAEEQQKATDEQAQKTEDAQQQSTQAQAAADKKRDEAQSERTTIAEDQKKVMEETAKNESAPSAYGLKNIDDLGVLSGLVKMNAATGAVMEESPVTVIRARTICETSDSFIAIAGEAKGNGAVRIVRIKKDTMAIDKQGNETVSDLSVIVENGGSYYCVIKDGSNWVVAKYNANLELQLKSPVNVKQATPITISNSGVLVTSKEGQARLLNLSDLSLVTDTGNAK